MQYVTKLHCGRAILKISRRMTEAKQVLRGLLRVVRQRIAPRRDNPTFHGYIIEEFRNNAAETDPKKAQELLRLAKDYTDYVHAVHNERVSRPPDLALGALLVLSDES